MKEKTTLVEILSSVFIGVLTVIVFNVFFQGTVKLFVCFKDHEKLLLDDMGDFLLQYTTNKIIF